jgi:hypothetical protein
VPLRYVYKHLAAEGTSQLSTNRKPMSDSIRTLPVCLHITGHNASLQLPFSRMLYVVRSLRKDHRDRNILLVKFSCVDNAARTLDISYMFIYFISITEKQNFCNVRTNTVIGICPGQCKVCMGRNVGSFTRLDDHLAQPSPNPEFTSKYVTRTRPKPQFLLSQPE